MNEDLAGAYIGLLGVGIGALVSLIGTVVIPWIRDTLDRKRVAREVLERERRDALLGAMAALLDMRQRLPGDPARGEAQALFGARTNELTVRLTEDEQPVLDVLFLMLAMVQGPRPDIANMIGESMTVLNLWARGDVATSSIISEVERRADVTFSADRQTASKNPKPAPDPSN